MRAHIELTEEDLKTLIQREIQRRIGDVRIPISDISIEVKSKQNYRSEWEAASFRATFHREWSEGEDG